MTAHTLSPRLVVLVHAAFFLSGVASLACEIVWFKAFGLVLGNGTFAVSTVVATFFIGLGLGSIAVGRLADRWTRPLMAYGVLELVLALASAATTATLLSWQAWIGVFRPWMTLDAATAVPLKVAIAAGLLLVPTMLMGSTLPVLARFLVRFREELSGRIGWLYAINTLGAAIGCSAVAFLAIGQLGLLRTGLAASAIYAIIGLASLWVGRGEAPFEPESRAEPAPTDGRSPRLLIAVFAMSGFVSVSYEIIWFRLLAVFSVNTVYAFASMLSVYLLGLVIGAVIAAKWLSRSPGRHLVWFARLQLAIAGSGLITLAAMGRFRNLLALLEMNPLDATGAAKLAFAVLLVLILPTVLIGLTFPLASEITTERLSGLGSRLGLVYGLNTIAGALGSLITGFVCLPLLGTQTTAFLLAGANLLLFAGILWSHPEVRREAGIAREGLATLATVAVVWVAMGPSYLRDSQTKVLDSEILSFRETADGTFLMVEYEEEGVAYQQVIVNGTSYANNRPPGRRYMGLLAHLPILLHPDPSQVVVICVGTGTTVGAASIHADVDVVHAVDLSAEIFRLAPDFTPWNHAFHEADHVRQIVADGRHFLTVTDDRFDVLTFEPPPPIEAGVTNLYSREFYQLADSKTNPGGLVAQWIPFQQGYEELQRELVQTMRAVYPHVSLWVADRHEGIVIGAHAPLQIDLDALRRRMAEPRVAEDLRQIGIATPEDMLATFVAADDELAAYLDGVGIVTDDRPSVERFLAYDNDRFTMEHLLTFRAPVERYVTPAPDPAAMARSRAWTDALFRANDHELRHDFAGAAKALEPVLPSEPGNDYLAFRHREMLRSAARR